jgi:hypothetical protein
MRWGKDETRFLGRIALSFSPWFNYFINLCVYLCHLCPLKQSCVTSN